MQTFKSLEMKKFLILLLLISIVFSSCKKFLVEKDLSSQTISNFYKTEADAQSAVNGIYSFLYPAYARGGNYDEMPQALFEMITGQWNNESQSPETDYYYRLQNTSGSSYTKSYWINCYKGIECANLVISKVPAIAFADNKKKQSLIAEARFLRAYYYYLLVNIFGDVPLKLTPTVNPKTDGLLPRTAVATIYNSAIVPDLQFAETNLQYQTPVGNGRVNVGAAKTLLAKVYLSMAGNPVNVQGAMALAKAKALEVINSNSFSLFQSDAQSSWFDKLNSAAYDNQVEHIWDLNYNYPDFPSSINNYFLPKEVIFTSTGFLQFGGFYPDPNYLNSFDPQDLRGKHNMGFFYDTFTTGGKTYNFPWAVYKYFDKGILTTSPYNGKGIPLLRYADLLLTYAEAQNETDGGPDATSYSAVNAIRTRAGLPSIANLTTSQFRDEVWKERYWELCAENKTYFDIVRTQKVYDAKQGVFVPIVGFTLPSGVTIPQGYLPFPIPLTEVQTNPLLGK